MTKHAMKIITAVALVALGGLAGFALGAPHGDATASQQTPPPVEVRTEVIRHTVRIHRKPKAPKHPPRAAAPASAPPPQAVLIAQPSASAPAAAPAPVRTRTSGGASGGEHEHEHESEGGDD